MCTSIIEIARAEGMAKRGRLAAISQADQRGLIIPIGKFEIRSISLSSKSEGSRR